MSTYRCCDTLAIVSPDQYVGGHHPACPATEEVQGLLREARAHIERSCVFLDSLADRIPVRSLPEGPQIWPPPDSGRLAPLLLDLRAEIRDELGRQRTLRPAGTLAALRERAEVERLRPIVEEVRDMDLIEDEYPFVCKGCYVEFGNGKGGQNPEAKHLPDCIGERAKAIVGPRPPTPTPEERPDLYECAACSAKPGAPALCARCLEASDKAGRAWLGMRPAGTLAALRERAEVERLPARECAANTEAAITGVGPAVTWSIGTDSDPDKFGTGTLASIPPDECDGVDR